jgi:hypothetical protein
MHRDQFAPGCYLASAREGGRIERISVIAGMSRILRNERNVAEFSGLAKLAGGNDARRPAIFLQSASRAEGASFPRIGGR